MTDCSILPGGGFGAGAFGGMPYGTGVPNGIVLLSAEVISANEVSVEFAGDLLEVNPCLPSDVTNVNAWEITIIEPPNKVAPFVQHVTVDEENNLLSLFFDRELCCNFEYRIRLTNQPEDLEDCVIANFIGPCVDPAAKQQDNRDDDGFIRDIANPFLTKDAVQTGPFLALGTYEITTDGDLGQDSGISSLRKRIYRRAITLAGEFFHLQGYGSDLETKRLVKPDLLRRYQEKLRVQIEREPEVRAATVRVGQVVNNPDVVAVYIRAQTQSGDPVDLNVPITLP